jgi:hypothetical protein
VDQLNRDLTSRSEEVRKEERKIVTLTGDLTCKTREDVNAQVTLDTQVKLAEKIRLEKL